MVFHVSSNTLLSQTSTADLTKGVCPPCEARNMNQKDKLAPAISLQQAKQANKKLDFESRLFASNADNLE